MINLTDDILIINNKYLEKALKDSFIEISELTLKHNNASIPVSINRNTLHLSFPFYFNKESLKNIEFDASMLNDFLEYAMNPHSENILLNYNFIRTNNLLEKPYLKSAVKLVLVDLWKKGFILLPLHFNLKVKGYSAEFLSFFDDDLSIKIRDSVEGGDYFKKKYPQSISKIIRASDYKCFEDILIQEINWLHIYTMKSKRGDLINKCPNINFFIESFLKQIKTNNESFNYDPFEYNSWLSAFFTRHKELNYLEYLESRDDLHEYRLDYVNKQTKERKRHKKDKNKNIDIINVYTIEDEFLDKTVNHSWKDTMPHYDGYSFNIEKDSKLWIDLFEKYLEHKKDNGYETLKNQYRMFNFFMNYIFFYLNLWNMKNHDKINLPLSPKEFHRTIFFTNKNIKKENEKTPFTLIDFLNKKTTSTAVKNSFIRELCSFFNFIIDFYSEEEHIWDKNLVNPFKKIDQFREFKNKKTNKVIIPKSIYGKLKKYLFCLEFFGEYLLEKSLETTLSISNNSIDNIKTEDYGFIPVFFFENKVYPLLEIPNTYFSRRRSFNKKMLTTKNKVTDNQDNLVVKRIPSITVIRAFILMLNTGLRGAQVSWIDIDTWDKYTTKELNLYYKLNVNTDKVKDSQWQTYISKSVYDSLTKETFFQNSMRDDFMQKEIVYQNREQSRFPDIKPLFRGHTKHGLPVNFRDFWTAILWCFQNTLNPVERTAHQLIKFEKPEAIELLKNNNNPYCKLNIKAIHTPHSMRATFCTHMSEYLERSEIASLVGHQSDLITSEVYIKPEEITIINKMNEAINIFENGVNSDYFNKDSLAHTKPNARDSSLQKAFTQDRDQTIELFNISSISMNINKESDEQSSKAIKLLKDARMDQIIFDTTHICPVGGMCPQEVMNIIGEKRRCGLCPLALKCIDNLNPIYAKQRDLIREIKNGKEQLDLAVKNKDSEISIHNIEDKVNLDIRELVSWKFSSDILSVHYEELKNDLGLDKKYFVEMPDMVKNHLTKVSVANEKEYLLTRLADANAYASYNTPENKYKAEMLRRDIIKNIGIIEYDDYYVSDDDKIEVFCSMIKNMMDSNGINLKNLVEYDCFKYIENQKTKQEKLVFNKNIKLIR